MTCEDTRIYLPAYLDNELDVADCVRVQKHLSDCAACNRARERELSLRIALRNADLKECPSTEFEKRLKTAVREAAKQEARLQRSSWLTSFRWTLAAAAALLIVTAFGALLVMNSLRGSHQNLIASAVFASHMRSLEAGHLVDVPSSDRHTVKPWFQGKLDFSPSVPDLSARGWPLIGGRLDYIDNRTVAALVYQSGKHDINVFLWPNHGQADDTIQREETQGYQILHWNGADMTYWVISDLNRAELLDFAQALREQ